MSVDEVSSRVGEFLVAEMEVPATWSEGFSSSKAGDDCPFILPNFSRLLPCCQRRARSLERPKPPSLQHPGCPPWRRPTQLELVITGCAELSQAGQDRGE